MQQPELPQPQQPQPQIYCYKFSEPFMIELHNFSKIHQYDDRKEFKSAWVTWTEKNVELIEEETRRLHDLNYNGDINNKMFCSARYYFRKKSSEKKEQPLRHSYIYINRDIINAMDAHILKQQETATAKATTTDNSKPSAGFLDFCKENIDLLSEEIARLYSENMSAEDIKKKIKKTYKNRYFLKVNIN